MAGAKFELSFQESQFNAAIQAMAASPAEIQKAADRAARHTLRAMQTLIAKSLSKQFNIPYLKLRARLNVRKYNGASPVWILWVGLNPMAVDQIGNVSQNTVGLQHRNGLVKGGFHQGLFGQGRKAWIRKKRARELGLKLPWMEAGNGRQPPKELKHKFPVIRIGTDLGAAAGDIIQHFNAKAKDRFVTRFVHELEFIRSKK